MPYINFKSLSGSILWTKSEINRNNIIFKRYINIRQKYTILTNKLICVNIFSNVFAYFRKYDKEQ